MEQAVDDQILARYGWNADWAGRFDETVRRLAERGDRDPLAGSVRPGRVVRHDGVALYTALADGTRHVRMRPGLPAIAVGDWVAIDDVDGDDIAIAVMPRASVLQRRDPSMVGDQLLAANVDIVVIVCGLDRPVKPARVQRATTLAWEGGATPLVVLTKADLVPDAEATAAELHAADPTVDVHVVATKARVGLDAVESAIRDRTIVLLGESGAGKSTLVNALSREDVAMTGTVRRRDAKGRHTTTARQLHLLPAGGCVIDTPGLRAIGLAEAVGGDDGGEGGIDQAFDDVMTLAEGCRFRNCVHGAEPGCAVRAAIARGDLDAARLDAWIKLRDEALAGDAAAIDRSRRPTGRPVRPPGAPHPRARER